MMEQRYSDNDVSKRDIPSFIEPRPPLIQNPFMRQRPQKGTNLLELFEEDSDIEEPEWVQVYLRLKPCKIPNNLYEIRSDKCLVTSLDTATAGHGRRTQHNVSKMYTFSKIFGAECDQKDIFESVVKQNLRKLPDGQNFTLLTYGASGSGKTYTLMGTVGAPGLVPRSLEYVFRLVDAAQHPAFKPAENGAEQLNYERQDYELQWVKRLRHVSAAHRDKYRRMSAQLHSDLTVSSIDLSNRIRHYVWVSFVEIYNDALYDLLVPSDKRTKLRIREDSSGNVYVKGATQAFVRSGEEAYDVMVAGKHNLMVAATGVHAHSSRSHCIFTITMLTETGSGSVRTSSVRLCDLAGCERARATRNTGARMAESRAINSSLHVLERCLHMLRSKQKSGADTMVPYRESKLTRLLGTGLSGAKGEAISIVVTLNPSPEYAHETKHVLGLAVVAQDIQVNNTIFASTLESSAQETTINYSSEEVMKLRTAVERLNFELAQAQARIKELMASMDERQRNNAKTMRELVDEAKDLTKQYYEARLEALRCEMDDMKEEYENRLANLPAPAAPTAAGSPVRLLDDKVYQLMTENAVLEEKLTAENLARVHAEKEVQELRACLEKILKVSAPTEISGDLQMPASGNVMSLSDSEQESKKRFKVGAPTYENVMSVSESEQESDEEIDLLNESLEPIFKNSIPISQNKYDDSFNNYGNTTYNNEITHEESDDSMENYTTDADNEESVNNETQFKNESNKCSRLASRGTYFISDSKYNETCDFNEDFNKKKINSIRGTYFVQDPLTNVSKSSEPDDQEPITDVFKAPLIGYASKVDFKLAENIMSKIVKQNSNVDMKTTEKVSENLGSKIIREKSKIDMTIPQQVAENLSQNIIREKYNIEMRAEKSSEPLVSKIIRDKSNVSMNLPEKVSKNISRKIIREKSDVEIIVTENLQSEAIREKSIIDITSPPQVSKNLCTNIIREKSDTDMRAKKVSEPQVSKIIREKSDHKMNVPENLSKNITKIIREKSDVEINVTENLRSEVIREKSIIGIKSPPQVSKNLCTNIIREKSDTDMRAKKVSEPQVSKIIREKSDHKMNVPENLSKNITKIIREKSDVEINVTENLRSEVIREKSIIGIKSPPQVSKNLCTNIIREKSDTDMRAKKVSEPQVSKIINEKSDININEPENLPQNITKKILREKSDVEINVTENLRSDIIKEKSIINITRPSQVSKNLSTNIIREKSDTDMRAIKVSEPLVSKENVTRKIKTEKSDVEINVTENLGSTIIREKSNIVMKPPEPISGLTREKSNVQMKDKSNVEMKAPDNLVNKLMRSFKSNQGSDVSLRQFEQLEKASKECNDDVRQNQSVFSNIKILKEKRKFFDSVSDDNYMPKENQLVTEKRTYFDNIGANINVTNKRLNDVMKCDEKRSPSIVKDVVADHFEPNTIKKPLGESLKKSDVSLSIHKTKFNKKHDSVDMFDAFDSPVALKTMQKVDNVETSQSIDKVVLDLQSAKNAALVPFTNTEPRLHIREEIDPEDEIKKKMKLEPMSSVEESAYLKTKLEPASSIDESIKSMNETQAKGNNTMDEFESIYKDITASRTTEFELLVSQEVEENTEQHEKDELRYNLRKKNCGTDKSKDEEILAESVAKSECKVRKRALRLRRRKNQDEETNGKLKDTVNLQSEFSDVTLDVPAPQKEIKDIPSPEKGAEENLPPLMGIQSCPSKSVMHSVTRSRRKLFTPRAEPLEESPGHTGDSNERLYVPRPSYHRPRARRKL